jgi:hypothetical protein
VTRRHAAHDRLGEASIDDTGSECYDHCVMDSQSSGALLIVASVALAACGGRLDTEVPRPDAESEDAIDESPFLDVSPPPMVDADPPELHVDPTCPSRPRTSGTPCEGTPRCDYLRECGGVLTLRCMAGAWDVEGEPCPDVCRLAVVGKSCPISASGRTCELHTLAGGELCFEVLACDDLWSKVGDSTCGASTTKKCGSDVSCPPTIAGCTMPCEWCYCRADGHLVCLHPGAMC